VALYTSDSKDRVRDAVDFVELVSARTELRRAGPARYEGLCPFHDERTPSFGIDPAQKVYHCFGCQASGDVFTFVQETEGVDFKGALELLAERYGVELEREEEDPREAERRQRRSRLLELLARTSAYYERYLWESSEAAHAREYLSERGLSEELLKAFRVGYAPSAWNRVLLASRSGGYSEQELYATGLAQRSKQNNQPYDRFRSRIMFPLADIRGRVLGFGARAMSEEQRPKYLNTSDNDVYHKGLHLYGADLARPNAARAGEVILCEGYTDTIALHQAGMTNAVGLMGTALTGDQMAELARMAHTVLLALDADSAGQDAMLKAFEAAEKRKLKLRVVPLPEGSDPAELIQREGPAAMSAALGESVPFERFRVEYAFVRGDSSSSEGRERIVDDLRAVFAVLPAGTVRMELTKLVSGRLELPESVAEEKLAPTARRPTRTSNGSRAATTAGGTGGALRHRWRGEETERAFLALCISSPQEGRLALESLDVDAHFASELLRRAARRLRDGSLREPMSGDAERVGDLDEDRDLKALLAELIVEAGREQAHPAMLEVQRLQLELARVEREIQRARGAGRGDVSALAHEKAQVKHEFDLAYSRVLDDTGEREG
jgi:DNA primase